MRLVRSCRRAAMRAACVRPGEQSCDVPVLEPGLVAPAACAHEPVIRRHTTPIEPSQRGSHESQPFVHLLPAQPTPNLPHGSGPPMLTPPMLRLGSTDHYPTMADGHATSPRQHREERFAHTNHTKLHGRRPSLSAIMSWTSMYGRLRVAASLTYRVPCAFARSD